MYLLKIVFVTLCFLLPCSGKTQDADCKCYTSADSIAHITAEILSRFSSRPDDAVVPYFKHLLSAPGFNFYTKAPWAGDMPASDISIPQKLAEGFESLPKRSRSRLDSLRVLTNFVYTLYPDKEDESGYKPADCDSLANLLYRGVVGGECGDISDFENAIIRRYFPHWGEPVLIQAISDSNQSGEPDDWAVISHVFAGIADYDGKVPILFDPSNNIVWFDSLTGDAISLDSARIFLRDAARGHRMTKGYSDFYGSSHPKYAEGDCPYFPTLFVKPGGANTLMAYKINSGQHGFIIHGDLKRYDYRDPLWGNPIHDRIWKKIGVHPSVWDIQCMTLLPLTFQCRNDSIKKKLDTRYGRREYK